MTVKKIKVNKFPCLKFKQGSTSLYSFTANSDVLWSILKINRRKEDKDEGYQRTLSQSRVKAIAKYIDSGRTIPNSIVVSLDSANFKDGVLEVENKQDSGWVIDGQHRLAGAHEAKTSIELNVIAFVGIDNKEQIEQFVTINKEQKGVPSSLYIDLLPHLSNKKPADIAKERAADIAFLLRTDEHSPFFNRIVITTSPKAGYQVSLTNFVRKITPLIIEGKGILSAFPVHIQKSIIDNYYLAIKNVFSKEYNKNESVFFRTIGFGALINALPTVLTIGLSHYGNFKLKTAIEIFQRIDFFEFSNWKSIGTGNQAETLAGEDLKAEINSAYDDSTGKDIIEV